MRLVSAIGPARVRMPEAAAAGDVIEIRALVQHPMESGFRPDATGRPIPRHIVRVFTCHYDGREVFRAALHPAVAMNPYFQFHVRAVASGEFVFRWEDDQDGVASHSARLTVT